MKIEAQHEYQHPVDKVYKAFTDPNFYVAKFEAIGARNVKIVESTDDDDTFSIITEREVPVNAPAALRSFIGDWNRLEQEEFWQGEDDEDEYYNELTISSPSVPVSITGVMTLSGDDKSCVNDVEITVTCNIPLLGGKLEKFVAGDAATNLDNEFEFITKYLAGD